MTVATAPLRYDFAPHTGARLPLSFAASVALHAIFLVLLGLLLHAMPPTVSRVDTPLALRAQLVTAPMVVNEAPVALPVLPNPEPLVPMLPVPAIVPSRSTVAPGMSSKPTTIATMPEVIPVGRASYGGGDRGGFFGRDLATSMREHFPDIPTRLPRLNGTLTVLYPAKAALQGRSKSLGVLLSIDANGRITDARVAPDDPDFAMAILTALRNVTFTPATIEGKPVPYWAVMSFDFAIDGPTGPDGRAVGR